jgi:hypothetical protein
MTARDAALLEAFAVCAGELGMFSAARVFLRELASAPEAARTREIVSALSERYPVFDALAGGALARGSVEPIDPEPVASALRALGRVVVVGIEAHCLDVLLPRLLGTHKVALVPDIALDCDMDRLRANLPEQLALLDIGDFQKWAGRSSALLTTVYGADGFRATVCQAWLRAHGPDVRTRFRSIVGWNVLGPKMDAYPMWLAETDAADFTRLIELGEGTAE